MCQEGSGSRQHLSLPDGPLFSVLASGSGRRRGRLASVLFAWLFSLNQTNISVGPGRLGGLGGLRELHTAGQRGESRFLCASEQLSLGFVHEESVSVGKEYDTACFHRSLPLQN